MRKRVDKRAAQANRRVLRAMGHRIKKRSRALLTNCFMVFALAVL